jgi:hypothetical protein
MADSPTAVQQAVQRALTEALGTIQRQLADVQGSFETVKRGVESGQADSFVGLLPSLIHMQAAGAALAATVESVLRFVGASAQWTGAPAASVPVAAPTAAPVPARAPAAPVEVRAEAVEAREETVEVEPAIEEAPAESVHEISLDAPAPEPATVEAAPPAAAAPARVDVDSLPDELRQLHQKAKRFAKVTVQDIVNYKKAEVAKGRESKDLYQRFREEIDRSKTMYDKRFEKIAAHHIDYLYDELVRVLADNDPDALGSYPYRPR